MWLKLSATLNEPTRCQLKDLSKGEKKNMETKQISELMFEVTQYKQRSTNNKNNNNNNIVAVERPVLMLRNGKSICFVPENNECTGRFRK